MSEKISLVVPCYNEEEVLPYFYEEFCKVAEKLSEFQLEVIFVDDGSKDRTLAIVKELAEKDTRVKYLSFSRNFGKESAVFAGLFRYPLETLGPACRRRLCGNAGCGFAGPAIDAAGNASRYPGRRL